MVKAIDWTYWETLRKAVRALVARELTAAEIAAELNKQGIGTLSGKGWTTANLQWAMQERLGISTATYKRSLPSRKRRASA